MAGDNGERYYTQAYARALDSRPGVGTSHRARHRRLTASASQLSDGRTVREEAKTTELGNVSDRRRAAAWDALGSIGEIATLVDGTSGLLSQCRFYVGARVAVGDKLVDKPVEQIDGIDAGVAATINALWDRHADESGSQSGLIRSASQNWSVEAQTKLVGYWIDRDDKPMESPPPDAASAPEGAREVWRAVSVDSLALENRDKGVWVLQLRKASPIKIYRPAVYTLRWDDPRYPHEPQGWVMNALDICRDLQAFTRAQRSAARSGIPADLLVIASEANPKKPAQLGRENTEPDDDDLTDEVDDDWALTIESLIGEVVLDALKSTEHGASVVPAVLSVGLDFVEKFNKISFARQVDRGLGELVNQARERLAEVADCPPEMLKGLGSTNRWNGGQIADDEYRRYFRPKANALADAFTAGPFRTSMLAAQLQSVMVENKLRILVDPSEAVASPDYTKLVGLLLDRFVIGPSGALELLGLPESLAPSDDEIDFMKEIKASAKPKPADNPGKGDQGPDAAKDESPESDDTKGSITPLVPWGNTGSLITTASSNTAGPGLRTIASIARPLGEVLNVIELSARGKLEEAAEAAFDRTMDRVTAKLTGWARREKIKALTHDDMHRMLAAASQADLYDAALDSLVTSYRRIVTAAYADAMEAIGDTVSVAEIDAAMQRGELVLVGSMIQLAEDTLFDVAPGEAIGEVSDLRVPLSVIRLALGTAGGAITGEGLDANPDVALGLTGGPLLDRITPNVTGLYWVYGPDAGRRAHFKPHLDLAGERLSGLTDPKLAQDTFPAWGYYFPGDHRGCRCSMIRTYED